MSSNVGLTIGGFEYDATRALFDGTVTVDGPDVAMRTARTLPEIFDRMIRHREVDCAELGMPFYLGDLDADASFVAIPAFPNRLFRHSAVYVNSRSGIREPADLVGKTIGELGIYGQDPGVWIKGMLMDEYGFRPEVVPREFADARPDLVTSLYDAFLESKNVAAERYRRAQRLYQVPTMLPWMNSLVEADIDLLGDDWWP